MVRDLLSAIAEIQIELVDTIPMKYAEFAMTFGGLRTDSRRMIQLHHQPELFKSDTLEKSSFPLLKTGLEP